MKLWSVLLFALVFPLSLIAKSNYYDYFNRDQFWQRLVIDKELAPDHLKEADTVIIVASNRALQANVLRFMKEERDKDSVRFFVVYTRGTEWHVHRCPSLGSAIALLPDKDRDWVVYTEGMGKIFTSDLDRGLSMAGQYGVNVLLLDYPSIRTDYKGLRNYRFVMHHSNSCHRDFIPVMDTFRKMREAGEAGNGALTLFFHSMGNNVIRRIAYSDHLKQFNSSVWVDNIVLNAPCVPRRNSGSWINNMRFAKRVFVHYNPYDNTLKWARILSHQGILGERPRLAKSQNARYINFHQLCGDGHSNFLSLQGRTCAKQAAVAHYSRLLHGQDVHVDDHNLYRQERRIVGYYITDGASISKR